MTVPPFRVGIVGLGFGARVLVPAFRSVPGVEVAALAGTDAARARKAAESLGIARGYGDGLDLARDPGLDAVVVAVPPAAQGPIALAALAAGRAVFLEKPVAVTEREAKALAAAARQARVANMVDFEFLASPAWRRARAELVGGAIGRLLDVQVTWAIETAAVRLGERSWKTDGATGGGTLSQFVCHTFAYLDWLLGPARSVSARLFPLGGARTADTLAVLVVETESGAVATVTASSHALHGRGHWLEFHGTEGALVLENSTPDYLAGFRLSRGLRGGPLKHVAEDPPRAPGGPDGRIAAVAGLATDFVAWARGGPAARPNLDDGWRVQALLEAARASSEAGGAARPAAAGG